jgi:hypothetical protein
MTPTDVLCIALCALGLIALVVAAVWQAYRQANPKPRPPGSLTTVDQGRAP